MLKPTVGIELSKSQFGRASSHQTKDLKVIGLLYSELAALMDSYQQ